MNIPQNFEKIDNVKFNIDGSYYHIEADHTEPGDVWVYEDTGRRHPLCFDIDWQKQTYALIKCSPGNGRSGNVLATDALLIPHLMKDMDSFINTFIKDTVTTLIKNNLI